MKNFERKLTLFVLLTVAMAWLVGMLRQDAQLVPFIKRALPDAEHFKLCSNRMYVGLETKDSGESTVGYVAIGTAKGYGGPMTVAVGLDMTGNTRGIAIIEHKETLPYFQKVVAKKFPAAMLGKKYSEPFTPGEDLDAVTGATLTLNALTESVRLACRNIAGKQLKLPLTPEKKASLKFGFPELILLLLFAVGFAGYGRKVKAKKLLRWVSLLTGLIALGFIYNIPLTLANINSLLLGYLPNWRNHLYWYFLIAGILLPFILIGKSPYCENFCPFGAAQQCLGAIGGAKPRIRLKYHFYLRWIQRALAWAAVILALVYRNPGFSSYEVFGTLFDFIGSKLQFGVLAIVLVVSLFLTRPWCNYLCPVRAVTDYIRFVRGWVYHQGLAKIVE